MNLRFYLTVVYAIGIVNSEFNVTNNGYFYLISYPLKLNWFQSLRYCRSINMHLIDLTTADEINRIAAVVKFFKVRNPGVRNNNQLTNFWTSGCDHGFNKFYWMSNGNNFRVTNWDNAQPDNLLRLEHCVEMNHMFPYKWNDEFCFYKKNFICRSIVLPTVERTTHHQEHHSPIADSEKPVRVANASVGYTHVSLI